MAARVVRLLKLVRLFVLLAKLIGKMAGRKLLASFWLNPTGSDAAVCCESPDRLPVPFCKILCKSIILLACSSGDRFSPFLSNGWIGEISGEKTCPSFAK